MNDNDKELLDGLANLSERVKTALGHHDETTAVFKQGVLDYMLIGMALARLALLIHEKETRH